MQNKIIPLTRIAFATIEVDIPITVDDQEHCSEICPFCEAGGRICTLFYMELSKTRERCDICKKSFILSN